MEFSEVLDELRTLNHEVKTLRMVDTPKTDASLKEESMDAIVQKMGSQMASLQASMQADLKKQMEEQIKQAMSPIKEEREVLELKEELARSQAALATEKARVEEVLSTPRRPAMATPRTARGMSSLAIPRDAHYSLAEASPAPNGVVGVEDADQVKEKVWKMAQRLVAAVGEQAQSVDLIKRTLPDIATHPEQAALSIEKEIRAGDGARQVMTICLEELFGSGSSPHGGGLVGFVLKTIQQACDEAEERADDAEEQVEFLSDSNRQIERAAQEGKLEKERAMAECNAHWTELNKRLLARKASSEIIATSLQNEMMEMSMLLKSRSCSACGLVMY